MAKGKTGLLMTNGQMHHIIQRTSATFPEIGAIREKVLIENFAASFGLIKDSVYVTMKKDSTRQERLKVSNSI
jgi:hypothetical protein